MRLIDADWVFDHLKPYEPSDEEWSVTGGTALRLIHKAVDNAPTVNVDPKREPAVWVRYSTTMMACSRCRRHTSRHRFEYCPHCGAPMRERKEE